MAIPQTFIQELVARADIVEIVGRHVQLKKGGANYMGLCPFHGEKSPSFSVSPTKQFYHCFGCGAHGNAIGFLMEHAGMGFVDAVHDLAGQVGLQVPEDDASPADRERAAAARQKQATLSDVLEKAGEAYRRQLKASPRAVEYLKGRGLSGQVARDFGLGYAPAGWHALASVFAHYDDPLLAESGLVIVSEESPAGGTQPGDERRYDRFRDRIMFPIRNVRGECIGFGGRVLGDEKPKYLNSPETPVFSKGRELYGLFEARAALREKGYALVTEGYMDVVALAQLGFPNAVATLGTACTPDHVQKLFRFTDAVVFSFDGDAAGRRAARKALDAALPFATDVRSVKFLFLPPQHDPDSFIREHGAEAFARFVAQATPLSRFLVEAAREDVDLGTAEGRARLASNARSLWSALPDGALKQQMLGELASLVQLDAGQLTGTWGLTEASARRAARRSGAAGHAPPARSHRLKLPTATEAMARQIALLLLRDSAFWDPLSPQEHEILCSIPGSYGDFFRWIDRQWCELGPQPLAALLIGMQGMAFEPAIGKLVDYERLQPNERVVEDPASRFAELQLAVIHLQLEISAAQLQEASALAPTDPSRMERMRAIVAAQIALRARRDALKATTPATM